MCLRSLFSPIPTPIPIQCLIKQYHKYNVDKVNVSSQTHIFVMSPRHVTNSIQLTIQFTIQLIIQFTIQLTIQVTIQLTLFAKVVDFVDFAFGMQSVVTRDTIYNILAISWALFISGCVVLTDENINNLCVVVKFVYTYYKCVVISCSNKKCYNYIRTGWEQDVRKYCADFQNVDVSSQVTLIFENLA